MSSTIYGFIACNTTDNSYEQCINVIEQLPSSGQMIVKHLFHLIPRSGGFSYYMNMITFGTNQKENWAIDLDFINQFERFLVQLDWKHAEIIHTWTGTRIEWNRHVDEDHKYLASTNFTRRAVGSLHDLPEIEL